MLCVRLLPTIVRVDESVSQSVRVEDRLGPVLLVRPNAR